MRGWWVRGTGISVLGEVGPLDVGLGDDLRG